jgi:hypothetical protein
MTSRGSVFRTAGTFCTLHSTFFIFLLEPPSQPSKPEIGFHVKEDATPCRTRKRGTA